MFQPLLPGEPRQGTRRVRRRILLPIRAARYRRRFGVDVGRSRARTGWLDCWTWSRWIPFLDRVPGRPSPRPTGASPAETGKGGRSSEGGQHSEECRSSSRRGWPLTKKPVQMYGPRPGRSDEYEAFGHLDKGTVTSSSVRPRQEGKPVTGTPTSTPCRKLRKPDCLCSATCSCPTDDLRNAPSPVS